MKDLFHNNISFSTTNKEELYKVWDDDLRNRNKKRNRWEWIALISMLLVVFGDTVLMKTTCIGFLIYSSIQVVKYFTEESHINYLMHRIDIDDLNFNQAVEVKDELT